MPEVTGVAASGMVRFRGRHAVLTHPLNHCPPVGQPADTEGTGMKAQDDRGLLLKVKLLLPERLWRAATRPAAFALRRLPERLVYGIGLRMRRHRIPYSLIAPGDVVFQIGAPADLLAVGRSRAAYFLQLVSGGGKLVVLEPDRDNCAMIEAFAARLGLQDRILVIPAGAWSETAELKFFESKEHPASAVLADLSTATAEAMARRGYHEVTVPVMPVDAVIAEHGLPMPKLVSITTNGAELEILKGMNTTLAGGGPAYISLAITGDRYREAMDALGYEYLADDDRGFTFRRQP